MEKETKSCKYCSSSIPKDAKVCPHCQKDLRNWFARHYILTTLLVLFILGSIFSQDKNTNNGSATINTKNETSQKIYKIGDTVSVGGFSYKISKIEDKKSLGGQYYNKSANGVFKIVYLTARNNDKEPKMLDNNMFNILDGNENKYSYSIDGDTAFKMSNPNSGDFFLKQLQPNLETSGVLIFDIPKDSQKIKLQVSGGYWSSDMAVIELN